MRMKQDYPSCTLKVFLHKILICLQDQKILERMLNKREDEEKEKEEQTQVAAMIEHEKQMTEYQKRAAVRKRTRSIGSDRLEREKRRVSYW